MTIWERLQHVGASSAHSWLVNQVGHEGVWALIGMMIIGGAWCVWTTQ